MDLFHLSVRFLNFLTILLQISSCFIFGEISSSQHGFIYGYEFIDLYWFYKFLFECRYTDAIYLDFSKAFDGDVLNHFYLTDFRLVSSDFAAPSGVPPSSHLGPLWFILFINDLRDKYKRVHFVLFADDLKLFYRSESILDSSNIQLAFIAWKIGVL